MTSRYKEMMRAKGFTPFWIGHLNAEAVEKARVELGETDRVSAEMQLAFKNKILEDTNMDCPVDGAYLLQYLRACKFNLKKSKTRLYNYYNGKKTYHELYRETDIPAVRSVFAEGPISFLPFRDENGCPIMLVQISKWNPEVNKFTSVLQALTCCLLHCIEDPATQVSGIQIMFDVRGFSLSHARHITPRYLNLISKALRNLLPIRFKGIHIYNESVVFQYLWGIFKHLVTEKIKNRVHFHGDNQKHLHRFVPKAVLPSEYGGDYATHSSNDFYPEEVEKFYQRFVELHQFGYKE